MPSRLSYVWLSLKRGLGSQPLRYSMPSALRRRCSLPTGRH